MPPKRRKPTDRLTPRQLAHLQTGVGAIAETFEPREDLDDPEKLIAFETEAEARRAWRKHAAEILAQPRAPFTRPWGFWRYDASVPEELRDTSPEASGYDPRRVLFGGDPGPDIFAARRAWLAKHATLTDEERETAANKPGMRRDGDG